MPALTPLILALALLLGPLVFQVNADTSRSSRSYRLAQAERVNLARRLLAHPRVTVLEYHVSGVRDSATVRENLMQTARGLPARRSYYGGAPGGQVWLDQQMLRALVILASEGYSFRLTELAGGSHSKNSRHYSGVAFDIDQLNGRKVSPGHPSYRRFLQRCRELGATEVFGPGTRGHSSHLHIAWPRPGGLAK